MAKKKKKNKVSSKKYEKYKEGSKAMTCPKCGPGIFLAEHKDRQTCGTCHYTQFKSKQPEKPKEAPKEQLKKE